LEDKGENATEQRRKEGCQKVECRLWGRPGGGAFSSGRCESAWGGGGMGSGREAGSSGTRVRKQRR
jgi:hypothetical protein